MIVFLFLMLSMLTPQVFAHEIQCLSAESFEGPSLNICLDPDLAIFDFNEGGFGPKPPQHFSHFKSEWIKKKGSCNLIVRGTNPASGQEYTIEVPIGSELKADQAYNSILDIQNGGRPQRMVCRTIIWDGGQKSCDPLPAPAPPATAARPTARSPLNLSELKVESCTKSDADECNEISSRGKQYCYAKLTCLAKAKGKAQSANRSHADRFLSSG